MVASLPNAGPGHSRRSASWRCRSWPSSVWMGLAVCWTVFGVCGFATGVSGLMAALLAKPVYRPRAWRVLWTTTTCLAIPPMLFLILTLALWTALLQAYAKWLPGDP